MRQWFVSLADKCGTHPVVTPAKKLEGAAVCRRCFLSPPQPPPCFVDYILTRCSHRAVEQSTAGQGAKMLHWCLRLSESGGFSKAHTHTTCLLSLTHVPIRCAVVVFCSPCTRLKKIAPGGRTPDSAGGAAWRPDVGECFERSGGPERAAVSREVRSNGTHKERREGGRGSGMILSLVLATMNSVQPARYRVGGGGGQRETM